MKVIPGAHSWVQPHPWQLPQAPPKNPPKNPYGGPKNYLLNGQPPAGAAAPAAPAIAPGQPGYMPDYNALIHSNPIYTAWQTSSQARKDSAAASRKAALQSLVTRFGGLPSGFTDAYGDLGDFNMSLATNNPYSQMALSQKGYQENLLNDRQQLAARGILQSGQLGFDQNALDFEHGQQDWQAGNEFMDAITGIVGGYTDTAAGVDAELPGVIGQASDDVFNNPAYAPVPAAAAAAGGGKHDPARSARLRALRSKGKSWSQIKNILGVSNIDAWLSGA